MKQLLFLGLALLSFSCTKTKEVKQDALISCGQCNFGLKEGGCDLAIKIDNKAYFVKGFTIDDFGDAHDKNLGLCNVIRTGEVTGKIIANKFIASTILLKN
jgi:hypothetical protein